MKHTAIKPPKRGDFVHPDEVERQLGGEDEAVVEAVVTGLPADVDPAIMDRVEAGISSEEYKNMMRDILVGIANSEYEGQRHTVKNNAGRDKLSKRTDPIPDDDTSLVGICYRALRKHNPSIHEFTELDDLEELGPWTEETFCGQVCWAWPHVL